MKSLKDYDNFKKYRDRVPVRFLEIQMISYNGSICEVTRIKASPRHGGTGSYYLILDPDPPRGRLAGVAAFIP